MSPSAVCVSAPFPFFPLHFLIASLSQSRLSTAENVGLGLQRAILWEKAGTASLDLAGPVS